MGAILVAGLVVLHALTGCGITARRDVTDLYKDKVVLIVNGDDVGVTPVFTDATLDAYRRGGISSVSIIATGHDVGRAIAMLKAEPPLPVGVHLTLTGDWEPLTAGASLRSATGLMWDTTEEVTRNVVPEEAAAEFGAQIQRILDTGLTLSHLDSHMGCYFLTPRLYLAAYDLAKKHGVPLISPGMPGPTPPGESLHFPVSSYGGIYRLPGGQEETLSNRTVAYRRMIQSLPPGVHYIYSHHGWVPPDGAITGDLDLRINDYKFWTDEETKGWLSAGGYVMIGCLPLKETFVAALGD
jgi:hypothetical protein